MEELRNAYGPAALSERIYSFALRMVRLVEALPSRRISSRVLGEQLLRAATSVIANYEEARGAISRREFVAKIGIAHKECRESVLWLRLIHDAGLIPSSRMGALLGEGKELRAILGSSLKTAR